LSVAFKDESLKASVIAALGLVVAALLVLVFAKGTKSTR
jgi:hypothetical protein